MYDTIVRMAQDFSLRHMLVDGQGNFGSVDGDNAAAMRYTKSAWRDRHECWPTSTKGDRRLLAQLRRFRRRSRCPAGEDPEPAGQRLGGIAVGMATNIPPHNLNEVVTPAWRCSKSPRPTIDELMESSPPRFFRPPVSSTALRRPRGLSHRPWPVRDARRTTIEDWTKGNKQAIIVDELPYQVNKRTLLEDRRTGQRQEDRRHLHPGRVGQVRHARGDRTQARRGAEVVLNNLYKQTQLQDTFGMNMVALVDGQPRLIT